MNKDFVKKMIKAKTLEYEAFKELFTEYAPKPVSDKVNSHAEEIKDVLKEVVLEMMKCDGGGEKCSKGKEAVSNKKNRKINVNFE